MSKNNIQKLPGFRDFYPLEAAKRNFFLINWNYVAQAYGFLEIEGPTLEYAELYKKKSGEELNSQIFEFQDQGDRNIVLRPEFTPSLARMVVNSGSKYKKPIRWYQIGKFFRFEKPQMGRTREFYQFNVDIIGDAGVQSDVETISLLIDTLKKFKLSSDDFKIHISHRGIWDVFLNKHKIINDKEKKFLSIIDKIDKLKTDKINDLLKEFNIDFKLVKDFMDKPIISDALKEKLDIIKTLFNKKNLGDFIKFDYSIIRGLAYYTGIIFEAKDCKKKLRAIAGGGRYDNLCDNISQNNNSINSAEKKLDSNINNQDNPLSAVGFGMGDGVLNELIQASPSAKNQMLDYLRNTSILDIYIVIADENNRNSALIIAQKLRENNIKTIFPLKKTKVNKQFSQANDQKARYALIIGNEYPTIKIKCLTSRTEEEFKNKTIDNLVEQITSKLKKPDHNYLITNNDTSN